MNLIYDIGNTTNKLAVYDRGKKVLSVRTKKYSCEELHKKISPFKIDKGIICSVKNLPDFIYDLIGVDIPFVHVLTHNSRLPFKIRYETPETLGPDRMAALAGALLLRPGKNVLVIDAGSAVTYDLLEGKTFSGGNISPGLGMRFRALHKFTGRLPLAAAMEKYHSPGRNTIEAITAGVIDGLVYEINEYIRTFVKKHPDLKVILTGGDSSYLTVRISHKKVIQAPDLVLDGLNYILEYNAK